MRLSILQAIGGDSTCQQRIETLLDELNLFSTFSEEESISILYDIYRWIHHSNRQDYKPVTQLTEEAKAKFPQLSLDLSRLSEIKSTWKVVPYYIDPVHSAASTLGRLGGKVKSPAKSTSSRENGRKGGRPRKVEIEETVNEANLDLFK